MCNECISECRYNVLNCETCLDFACDLELALKRLDSGDRKNMRISARVRSTPLFLRWKIEKQLGVQPMGVKGQCVALLILQN